MKHIIALLLSAQMAMAQGVVLFEKATGILQEHKIVTITTNIVDDIEIVTTNTIIAFQKLQPSPTVASGNKILGAQVAKRIDWTLYDLASYTAFADGIVDPITTNDLVGVTTRNCLVATDPQLGKSVTHRKYENGYFKLVKAILTLANDPRKDVTPIPKLSFDELDAILDSLYEVPASNKVATKLAMKLLSVNSALLRYDVQWWDSAAWHQEVE